MDYRCCPDGATPTVIVLYIVIVIAVGFSTIFLFH